MTKTWYGLNPVIPKTLYHYTSVDAMMSILGHKNGFVRMMATDCHFLNDDYEYRFGCREALKWLAGRPGMSSDFVSKVKRRLSRRDKWGEYPWITSFCAERDKTVQWMAYSDSKKGGVAIGFDTLKLRDRIHMIDDKIKESSHALPDMVSGGSLLAPCIYHSVNQRNPPDDFMRMLEYVVSDKESFYHWLQTDSDKYAAYCARHIVLISSLLKSDEFQFENEWRISIIPSGDFLKDKQRVVGNKVRLTLREFIPQDVISEIVLSPHGNRRLIAASVWELKSRYGYEFSVCESKSSYNGR